MSHEKCTTHPCPCGHPEWHCTGCSGVYRDGEAVSKAADSGSTPDTPAMQDLLKRDHLPEGSY